MEQKEIWNLKALKILLDRLNQKIKRISLNTSMDIFSTDDNKLRYLKNFNWLDNYFIIIFENYDELCIWDYDNFDFDTNTREKEQIQELLKDTNLTYTLDELNNLIELICKENNFNIN